MARVLSFLVSLLILVLVVSLSFTFYLHENRRTKPWKFRMFNPIWKLAACTSFTSNKNIVLG